MASRPQLARQVTAADRAKLIRAISQTYDEFRRCRQQVVSAESDPLFERKPPHGKQRESLRLLRLSIAFAILNGLGENHFVQFVISQLPPRS